MGQITNYPFGVSSFGLPLVGSGAILTVGNIFFVNSAATNASNGNDGKSPDKPLATIDYAVGLCTANNGDHILVHPNHTETVTAAGTLTLDVAGVTIIGMGSRISRPTINTTTSTAARVLVTAARCRMENFLFTGNIDAATAQIIVQAADFHLINCEYRDGSSVQTTAFLQTSAAADRMLIDGFIHRGDTAAGTAYAIVLVGGTDIEIRNFKIDGNFSTAAINIATTATSRLWIHDGFIKNRNSADVGVLDTITASTGWVGPNVMIDMTDNAANITEAVTGATLRLFGPVKTVNADNEIAMDINWTASTDA